MNGGTLSINEKMKKIGLIGGLSWHSSLQMYQYINQYIADTLGEYNCSEMVLVNVNLQDIFVNDSDNQHIILADAAQRLKAAGCDFFIICSNTMHRHSEYICNHTELPMLHIADATADAILEKNIHTIGLMGTRITMTEDFYRSRLEQKGLKVIIPDENDMEFIDNVLYNETGFGIVKESSKQKFYEIGEKLMARGSQGVILGCTEIGLLMKQNETEIPLFDTTLIHGLTAAEISMYPEKYAQFINSLK